jgi:hypothetical protein
VWREDEATRCEVRNAGNLLVEIGSPAAPANRPEGRKHKSAGDVGSGSS